MKISLSRIWLKDSRIYSQALSCGLSEIFLFRAEASGRRVIASSFNLLFALNWAADCRPSVPRGNNDTHQWIFVDLPASACPATEPCWGTGDLSDPESWLWPGVKHLYELNFSSMTCSVPTLAVCRCVVHSTLFIAGHLTSLQYSSVRLNQHIGPMNILDLPLCSSCQTALARLVTFIVIYWIWILEIKNGCMAQAVHFCHLYYLKCVSRLVSFAVHKYLSAKKSIKR